MADPKESGEGQEGEGKALDPLQQFVQNIEGGDPAAQDAFRAAFAEVRVRFYEAFTDRGHGYKEGLHFAQTLKAIELFRLKCGIQDHMTYRDVLAAFEEAVEGSPFAPDDQRFIAQLIEKAYRKMGTRNPESYKMSQKGIYMLIQEKIITVQQLQRLTRIAEFLGVVFDHLLDTRSLRSPIKSLEAFSERLKKGTFLSELYFGIRKIQEIHPNIDTALVLVDFLNGLPRLLQAIAEHEEVRFQVEDMTGLTFLFSEVLGKIPSLIHNAPREQIEETMPSGMSYGEFLSACIPVLKAIQRRVDQYLVKP